MRGALFLAVLVLAAGPCLAQTSASHKLEEFVFNSGGNPLNGTIPTSASYRMSLDSLGEGISATGLTSASHSVDACFSSNYPPPLEVLNLVLGPTITDLSWDPEKSTGVYNLYRDLISNLSGLVFGNCEQQDLATTSTTDADAVPAADGYFYLVTAENRLSEEGTKGFQTGNIARANAAPCP